MKLESAEAHRRLEAEIRRNPPPALLRAWRRRQRRKRVRQLLLLPFAWIGIALGAAVLVPLPHRLLMLLCDLFSGCYFHLDVRGRRRALQNLRLLRGGNSAGSETFVFDSELPVYDATRFEERILRRAYRNMARTVGHIFWTLVAARRRVAAVGELDAATRRALAAHRPAVTVSAHLGCWEILSQLALLEGHAMLSVAKDIGSPAMTRLLMRARRSIGQEIVPAKGAFKPLMAGLRSGKSIGLLVDQSVDPADGGVWVRFLGQPMAVSAAPAFFAAKAKVPIIIAWSRPLRGGRYRCELIEVIDAEAARDVWKTTQRCTAALERVIRRHPSCWVLNYNFFSNVPTIEDLEGLRRREAALATDGSR